MRALFVHDHAFQTLGDQVFSDKLPYAVWKRYLSHFSALEVVGRDAGVGKGVTLPLSSGPRVNFLLVKSASSFSALVSGGGRTATEIENALREVDFLIARLPSELGLLACRKARRMGLPYAVEVVGCAWDAMWNHGSVAAKLYAPVFAARTRVAVGLAENVSYVSEKFLQSRYPPTNAKHTAAVSNVELPIALDETLGSRKSRIEELPGSFTIGLIGSMNAKYKGIDLAIKALSCVRARGFDAQLRILGGGDNQAYVLLAKQCGVAQHVHFDGTLAERDKLMQWLDHVDCYIQPSYADGIPRALIEAMSRGCPAIGSACGGIPELLPDTSLIPVGNAEALANMLVTTFASNSRMSSMAEQNFVRARDFSKNILDRRRRDFFAEVTGKLHDN